MITTHMGGEFVGGGIYWSSAGWEFISIPEGGGRLIGGSADRYIRSPLAMVLIVGPLMGLVFAIFLPLSGLLILIPFLAGMAREAVASRRLSAAHLASRHMQPGVSYLESSIRAADRDRVSSGERQEGPQEERLLDLAKDIARKRWGER